MTKYEEAKAMVWAQTFAATIGCGDKSCEPGSVRWAMAVINADAAVKVFESRFKSEEEVK